MNSNRKSYSTHPHQYFLTCKYYLSGYLHIYFPPLRIPIETQKNEFEQKMSPTTVYWVQKVVETYLYSFIQMKETKLMH